MDIIQIYKQFPTATNCITHLENIRWDGEPTCPYCESQNSTPVPTENRHHCNNCNTTYSVTVGTVFHHSRLPLQKWFFAISLILNAKRDITARKLARDLHVNKNTAWYITMRIRKAMTDVEQRALLLDLVENDKP